MTEPSQPDTMSPPADLTLDRIPPAGEESYVHPEAALQAELCQFPWCIR